MAHLTTENLTKILDRLVTRPTWKAVMGSIGASEDLAFRWRAQSVKALGDNDRSSPFFLEWRNTWDWWHNHAGRARLENIITYEATIRDQALNGIEEPVLGPDQRPVYQEDPEFIGQDDDFVQLITGCTPGEVKRKRLLIDPKTNKPIPLTRRTQLPAQVRVKVLEQDKRYIQREIHDVNIQGQVAVTPALRRLPGEAPPNVARLKELAAMSPEERRKVLGASAVPLDANGRRTILTIAAPLNRDAPDDQGEIAKPNAAPPFQRPPQPAPAPPRPSYARPAPSHLLDRSGRGDFDPPPGGGPAHAPGNVR